MKNAIYLFSISCLLWSCLDEPNHDRGRSNVVIKSDLAIELVSGNKKAVYGDSVRCKLFVASGSAGSLKELSWNGKLIEADSVLPQEIVLPPAQLLGKNTISAEAIINNQTESTTFNYVVISDIVPVNNAYKVINTFPHDQSAYTQGFVIHDGTWYEGTGGEGVSDIRKVEKQNGKVILSVPLEDRYFGEGIAFHKDKIYQLTWKAQTGFVYDPAQFIQENTFFYEGEGWGLTSDSTNLIQSNGSNMLKFLDDKTWAVTRRLHVYDDKGPVTFLNELEYIDGRIWANVWQQEYIVIIDPVTGRVLERVKLKGLLKRNGFPKAEVLNGIAWDVYTNELFVTGKFWPFIYQIELIPQNI